MSRGWKSFKMQTRKSVACLESEKKGRKEPKTSRVIPRLGKQENTHTEVGETENLTISPTPGVVTHNQKETQNPSFSLRSEGFGPSI